MINFNEKKFVVPAIIIAILLLILASLKISQESRVILIPLLLWAVFSAYLIFKGRPDERGINTVRRLGVSMVIATAALMGGGIFLLLLIMKLAGYIITLFVFSLLLLIALTLIIAGTAYAFRKRAKIGLIPLFILGIVFLMIAWFWFGLVSEEVEYLPSGCNFPDVNLNCIDYVVGESVDIFLRNEGGRDMQVMSVTAYSEAFSPDGKGGNHACEWVKPDPANEPFILGKGEGSSFRLKNSTGVVTPGTDPGHRRRVSIQGEWHNRQ